MGGVESHRPADGPGGNQRAAIYADRTRWKGNKEPRARRATAARGERADARELAGGPALAALSTTIG